MPSQTQGSREDYHCFFLKILWLRENLSSIWVWLKKTHMFSHACESYSNRINDDKWTSIVALKDGCQKSCEMIATKQNNEKEQHDNLRNFSRSKDLLSNAGYDNDE